MKVAIVGYGSIGKKHFDLFKRQGITPLIISKHHNGKVLEDCLGESLDLIWICSKTSEHEKHLKTLESFTGKMIVEKPIFSKASSLTPSNKENIFVSYNLRHLKTLQRLKTELEDQVVTSASIYVGQYLPDWRPAMDYKNSYSSHKNEGGGVLRDLSHELDYALWIFGNVKSVCSKVGRYSDLEISSEDTASMLMDLERCPNLMLTMNYTDRVGKRTMRVNTNEHTYSIDFQEGGLYKDADKIESDEVKTTYIRQVKDIIHKDTTFFCGYDEGVRVLELITAIEKSNVDARWVNL